MGLQKEQQAMVVPEWHRHSPKAVLTTSSDKSSVRCLTNLKAHLYPFDLQYSM